MNPTDTLTNADLDQLDALAEAATPGPWGTAHHGTWEVEAPPNQAVADCGTVDRAKADAAFIAAARLAIPALVAEVRRLRGVASAAVAPPALGARLRDLTVAQLEALPVGARFDDGVDPGDGWDFARDADGLWRAPTSSGYSAAELLDGWPVNPDYDYRLAHLPESP